MLLQKAGDEPIKLWTLWVSLKTELKPETTMDIAELYFRPKKWEGNGKKYELFGVLIFKKFIIKLGRKTGQKSNKPNNYYLWDKSIEGIKLFERKTRYNELMHAVGIILPMVGLAMYHNDLFTKVILWLVLIVNIYPFLLQRYNRIRIYKLLRNKGMKTGP